MMNSGNGRGDLGFVQAPGRYLSRGERSRVVGDTRTATNVQSSSGRQSGDTGSSNVNGNMSSTYNYKPEELLKTKRIKWPSGNHSETGSMIAQIQSVLVDNTTWKASLRQLCLNIEACCDGLLVVDLAGNYISRSSALFNNFESRPYSGTFYEQLRSVLTRIWSNVENGQSRAHDATVMMLRDAEIEYTKERYFMEWDADTISDFESTASIMSALNERHFDQYVKHPRSASLRTFLINMYAYLFTVEEVRRQNMSEYIFPSVRDVPTGAQNFNGQAYAAAEILAWLFKRQATPSVENY